MQHEIVEGSPDGLNAYLQRHVEGFEGPVSLEKFSGGQSNPTYLLNAASGQYVLRRKPQGELLKSAHAVDREFRVISALGNTEVPVPEAIHLCEDESIIGSMFYLMSYAQGRLYWDPVLPELENDKRGEIYDEMNRVLAALHQVDIHSVGLGNYGRSGNYFERQLDRWTKQYRTSETENIKAMNELIKWLSENIPDDDGRVSLIHGDFRLDNMVFHPQENKVIALLDWELSTLGHPYADISYQCMQWRMTNEGKIKGLGDLDRPTLGIPSEHEYVRAYCQRMNIETIEHWHFFLAFNFFRFTAIVQGVKKRALEGNASSEQALEVGRLARYLAEMGVAVVDETSHF